MNSKEKIYLTVKVQPRSRKPGLEKLSSGEYKIRVLAPPSKGKANKEVIETLAAFFGLPPSMVKIVKGEKSRNKLALLEGGKEKLKNVIKG